MAGGEGLQLHQRKSSKTFALRIMLISYSALILLLMNISSCPSRQDYIIPKRRKKKKKKKRKTHLNQHPY